MQIGFFSLSFLILLILQLTNVICVPWWIVALPLVIPLVLVCVIIIFGCMMLGIIHCLDKVDNAKKLRKV